MEEIITELKDVFEYMPYMRFIYLIYEDYLKYLYGDYSEEEKARIVNNIIYSYEWYKEERENNDRIK